MGGGPVDAVRGAVHLVPVRVVFRRFHGGGAGARRGGDDGLFRADPARIRSQHRGGRADHHRLFAERQGGDRRSHPRKSAQISPDGHQADH